MSKFADLIKNNDKEAIKKQIIEQKIENIDDNQSNDGELKPNIPRKMTKTPHQACSRCGADLGTVDHWFDFGIKRVQYGYTMMPEPLCKECFKDLQAFMTNGDRLND